MASDSDASVVGRSYPTATPGWNASMATKWVAQMPNPTETAATASHTICIAPAVRRA